MEKNYITSKEKVTEREKLGKAYSNLEKVLNVELLIKKIIGIDIKNLSCPRPPTSKNSKNQLIPWDNLIRKNFYKLLDIYNIKTS